MTSPNVSEIVRHTWGYDELLPFQAEAIDCVLGAKDSLVVLPTGGGKSLCYQAPAIALDGMALIISPLIALMKDQVDSLRAVGVAAGCINSSLTALERREVHEAIQAGELKLLYAAPERAVLSGFLDYLKQRRLSFIAIDEAHCISHWGHDFRPEYRDLAVLREAFPDLAFHCYTATATPQVRDDICQSMGLKNPKVLVAPSDRPNLVFSAERRHNVFAQILETIERHPGESGIIYCITRKKVDEISARLRERGIAALPYHAGMGDEDRKANQQAFSKEEAEIIVATVAFGMGIDKPDVRFVLHTGMPKTIEHYQQESGRAGRDGLEAECRLLYSGADFGLWKSLLRELDEEQAAIAQSKLNDMYAYCTGVTCRHQALASYFGEGIEKDNCGACDLCLGSADLVDDAVTIGQKILSCVLRLGGCAGPSYTALVLAGSKEARILDKGHDGLSTWGLLKEQGSKAVRDWIEQLVAQDFLMKNGEYSILELTAKGQDLLRGYETPRLLKAAEKKKAKKTSAASAKSWAGVDRDLFEALRALRRQIAVERNAPAFTVFADAALRDMARRKPTTEYEFLQVHGVGEKKCADFASRFLPVIQAHKDGEEPAEDPDGFPKATEEKTPRREAKEEAFRLFEQGYGLQETAEHIRKALSTTRKYLEEYIRENQITDATSWMDQAVFGQIREAVETHGPARAKHLHKHVDEHIDVNTIAIAVACLQNEAGR